jgi:hypothetical protein
MDRNGRPHSKLTIALHKGLYIYIIIYRCGGPHSALLIALHRRIYIDI